MRISRGREYICHSMRNVVVKVQRINISIIMTRLMTGNETKRTISNRFNTRGERRNTRTKMMEAMQVMTEMWKGSVVGSRCRIKIRCYIMVQRVCFEHVGPLTIPPGHDYNLDPKECKTESNDNQAIVSSETEIFCKRESCKVGGEDGNSEENRTG